MLPALDLDHLSPLVVVVQDLGEAGVTDDAVVAVQGGPTELQYSRNRILAQT